MSRDPNIVTAQCDDVGLSGRSGSGAISVHEYALNVAQSRAGRRISAQVAEVLPLCRPGQVEAASQDYFSSAKSAPSLLSTAVQVLA